MSITRERMAAIAAAVLVAILAVVWFVTHHGDDHTASPKSATSSSSAATPSASSTSDVSEPSASEATQGTTTNPSSDATQSRESVNAERNAEQPLATSAPQYRTISTYTDLTNSQDSNVDRSQWFSQMKAVTTPSYYASTYGSSANQTLSPIQQAQASAWASQNGETPAPTVVASATTVYPVSDIKATATSAAYHVTYSTHMPGSNGSVGGASPNSTQTYTVFMKKIGDNWLVDNVVPQGS